LGANDTAREKALKDMEFRVKNIPHSPQWLTLYA
jgi:hypothetical protein